MPIRPVILCGGSGTRLWPLSTALRPKQFQPLAGPVSMLEQTALRVAAPAGGGANPPAFSPPLIVGSLNHRELIQSCLGDCELILEPVARNSAPAIAAAVALADDDELLLVLPADHRIGDVAAFHKAISAAVGPATDGKIVTFGIQPVHPATAYGYIEAGGGDTPVRPVLRFVEKPDAETARGYLETGRFYWNAGIFLFQAGVMARALERCAPDVIAQARLALGEARGGVRVLDKEAFSQAPSISIDYAVMEPLSAEGQVSVVPVDMDWSDLGDHDALYDAMARAPDNLARGPVRTRETEACSLYSDGPHLAVIGVKDLAVIACREAVLVTHRSRAQEVRHMAEAARGFGFADLLPEATRSRVRDWVFDRMLPVWDRHGWDDTHGGFREDLTLDTPSQEHAQVRRVRVQARQIYAFSHAHILGWSGAGRDRAAQGLDYLLTRAWQPGLGFAHRLERTGRIVDGRADTYDHAFVLTAMAWAHRAGVAFDFDHWTGQVLETLDTRLATGFGGYRDSDAPESGLRANPHMHLLEACLALYEARREPHWLARAQAIVELFERYFFDPVHDCVIEHFTGTWQPDPERANRIEPGHAYEWAVLLARFERHSGRDLTSWVRRLIAGADRIGRDRRTGFAYNCVAPDGTPIDGGRRLWPQTEMLRARLVVPGVTGLDQADALIAALFDTYLGDAGPGLWIDEYDADGKAKSDAVPASIVYHLMTAFAPVIDPARA